MKTMNGDLAVSIVLAAQKTKQAVYLSNEALYKSTQSRY